MHLIPPSKDELGGYLKDFPDPQEFIKTFKFHEGLLYSMKVDTEEKDWDYSYFLLFWIYLEILDDANTTMYCAQPLCKHCYFEIKALKNEDGSKIACPGCRRCFLYALPNDYLRKIVKTVKIECPRYHCNSFIQNGD